MLRPRLASCRCGPCRRLAATATYPPSVCRPRAVLHYAHMHAHHARLDCLDPAASAPGPQRRCHCPLGGCGRVFRACRRRSDHAVLGHHPSRRRRRYRLALRRIRRSTRIPVLRWPPPYRPPAASASSSVPAGPCRFCAEPHPASPQPLLRGHGWARGRRAVGAVWWHARQWGLHRYGWRWQRRRQSWSQRAGGAGHRLRP